MDRVVDVNSDTTVEQIVSYKCKDQYFIVPEYANTSHICVNGSWVNEKFDCLKRKLINKITLSNLCCYYTGSKTIVNYNCCESELSITYNVLLQSMH